MADKKITVEFNEQMAEFIEHLAADIGYGNAKEFIEMLAAASIFQALEQNCPSRAKH